MLFPALALLLTLNALASDAAFDSPSYFAESSEPLDREEMTVEYQYPENPCGTLMTEFTSRGSTHLGRGPVYHMMLKKCQQIDSNLVPDDKSVRTYACYNMSSYSRVLGKATFAFQCGGGQGDKQPANIPFNRIPSMLF